MCVCLCVCAVHVCFYPEVKEHQFFSQIIAKWCLMDDNRSGETDTVHPYIACVLSVPLYVLMTDIHLDRDCCSAEEWLLVKFSMSSCSCSYTLLYMLGFLESLVIFVPCH